MALPVNGSTHLIPAYYSFYRPRKDERLSWPSWLACSGWLTHISGHPSAAGRAQDRESSPARDRRSTTVPRHQLSRQCRCLISYRLNPAYTQLSLGGRCGLLRLFSNEILEVLQSPGLLEHVSPYLREHCVPGQEVRVALELVRCRQSPVERVDVGAPVADAVGVEVVN